MAQNGPGGGGGGGGGGAGGAAQAEPSTPRKTPGIQPAAMVPAAESTIQCWFSLWTHLYS